MNGTRVLITGATSGLGREMARQLGRRGFRLALTGRRADKLREAAQEAAGAGGECLELCGDAADAESVRGHYARIREAWGGLDWAVLNAGVSLSQSAREFTAENYRTTMTVNVLGTALWLEAVLPDMLAARAGLIAGIASVAAWRGLPSSGAYCASKAAMVAMLESVRIDLRGTGVEVVTVCPGFVKSEMTARHKPGDMPFLLETEDGVRRMIAGIEARRRLVHFPWQLSLPMKYLVRNLPGFLYEPIAACFDPNRKKRA